MRYIDKFYSFLVKFFLTGACEDGMTLVDTVTFEKVTAWLSFGVLLADTPSGCQEGGLLCRACAGRTPTPLLLRRSEGAQAAEQGEAGPLGTGRPRFRLGRSAGHLRCWCFPAAESLSPALPSSACVARRTSGLGFLVGRVSVFKFSENCSCRYCVIYSKLFSDAGSRVKCSCLTQFLFFE